MKTVEHRKSVSCDKSIDLTYFNTWTVDTDHRRVLQWLNIRLKVDDSVLSKVLQLGPMWALSLRDGQFSTALRAPLWPMKRKKHHYWCGQSSLDHHSITMIVPQTSPTTNSFYCAGYHHSVTVPSASFGAFTSSAEGASAISAPRLLRTASVYDPRIEHI